MSTRLFFFCAALLLSATGYAQSKASYIYKPGSEKDQAVLPAAYNIPGYLPELKGKRVALVVNQTSEIAGHLLPDTLISLGVNVVKIFSPEHGFRGEADAGAKVKSGYDSKTGLQIISLYGNNKKPTAAQLKDVDLVVYDLQDVGVRFYTYISTLQYLMEACAEYHTSLMILDRPDPLGYMVDGPVLESKHTSFIGMQPVPVVYGMTPGEYAGMLLGEKWITAPGLKLKVIPCTGYDHSSYYQLPVAPSPNLKNMAAIYLYPSLCFFEGTPVSLGRGTDFPFQQFGHPALKGYTYSFTPESRAGANDPPLKGKKCFGLRVTDKADEARAITAGKIQLRWLLEAYSRYPEQEQFFTSFFEKLSGTDSLRSQIKAGWSEAQIRDSWKPGIVQFKKTRKKYLLYKDFE